VAAEESSGISVLECLQALGVSLVTEWDTLAFLYSHSPSLGTAAQIARLIGYENAEIGEALHRLEALGLIHRSRVYQGTRLYRFSEPPEPGRHSCLLELMRLAQNRSGRLLLLKHLMRPRKERRRSQDGGLHLA
jgi:predicted transcriptional regulator